MKHTYMRCLYSALQRCLPITAAVALFILSFAKVNAQQSNRSTLSSRVPIKQRNCLDPDITLSTTSVSICESTSSQTINIPYSNTANDPITYSIAWNSAPPNNFTQITDAPLPLNSLSISIPANTTPGTYSGTLTVANAGGCVSPGITITISVNDAPSLGNDISSSYCANSFKDLTTLFNTTGLTTSWTLNGNPVANPSSVNTPGNYQLVVTNAAGCKDTVMVALYSTVQQTATIFNAASVCSNTTPSVNVIISSSTGGVFSGTPGLVINPTTGTINAAQSTAGTHTITYTLPAQGGCPAFTATSTIVISAPPVITLQPRDTGFCKFNNLELYSAASSNPAATVQWQVSTDGGLTYSNISGATSPTYNGGVANTNQDFWRYRVIYTNACGSTTSNVAVIGVSSPLNPQDNPVSQTGCAGVGSVTFFASGNGGNGLLGAVWQYSPDGGTTWIDIPSTWTYNNTGNISNTYTFTPTAGQNGYLFRLRFDNGRCPSSVSASASLTVNPIPTMNQPTNQVICGGGTVQPVVFSGTANSYTWTNNNTSIGLAASGTGNIAFFTAINNSSTVQTATITVTPIYTGGTPSVSCPGATRTFTITVNPIAIVNAGPAFNICAGSSVTLGASIGGGATSVTWSAPSGTFSNANALNSTYTPSISSGSVTLTLTSNDPDGPGPCQPTVATTTVTVNLPATADAGPARNVCAGTTITLNGSIGGSATSATWTAASGTFSNPTSLTSTYTPSITSGNVVLFLQTNDPAGPCPYASAIAVITVVQPATANAGGSQTICSNNPINLSGVVGGSATGGVWSAPSGTFGNPNSLTTTYTPTITSGTVTLTLTTLVPAGGCPAVTSTVAITVLANPVVTATSTNITCAGGSNGTASASATGSGLSYSWNTNPVRTGASQTNLPAGTYTVTVTDNKGCKGTATVTITQPPPLTANALSTNVICNGGSTGTASVTPSGGTPGYTYSWSTNPVKTTASVTGLAAGTYTVTVTDSKNCTTTATVTITQPNPLTAGELHFNPLCNGSATGTATITASGGTAPYTGTVTYTGLTAGSYNYTVTDANGCTKAVPVIISQPAAITISGTPTNILCNGGNNGSVTISASGGTAPYTGTGTFNNLTAGTQTFTVTDNNGCSQTKTITITEPPALVPAETHTNPNCFGASTGTATITATGGTAPYTGTVTYNNLAAGTYNYVVKDANNCTATIPVTITQPPALAVTATPTAVGCSGGNSGSASLSISGGTPGYTYSWNTTPVQTGSTATNLIAGNYTVIVTDSKGCTKSTPVTITQPTVLSASATPTNVLCNGANTGSVSVSASGGTGPYLGTGTYTGLTAGSYSYTVTDANGCTKNVPVTITQPTAITVTQTTTPVSCNGGNNGSVTISASGGISPYVGIGIFSGLSAGTYTYTVTDASGCTKSVPVTITEPAAIAATATPTNVLCNGGSTGSVVVSASGGTAPYTGTGNFINLTAGTYFYTVRDNKGCSVTVQANVGQPSALAAVPTVTNVLCNGRQTGSITINASGGTAPYTGATTYNNLGAGNYTYTVSDANGCTKTVTAAITQPPLLIVSGNQINVFCSGNSTGSITVNAGGGVAPYFGTGNYTGLSAGNYSYTVTDANGCTGTYATTITQPAPLNATATTSNVTCNGGSNGTVNITASGGTAPYIGTGLISGLTAGSHTFTVTDANGCTKTISVNISEPAPIVPSETHTNIACNGGSTGSATISATGGTGTLTGIGTFTGLPFGPNLFTVSDQNGCQATITVNITQATTLQVFASQTNVSCFGGNNGSVTITASGGTAPLTGLTTYSNLAAGTYTYFVRDNNNCSAFVTVTITQPDALVVSATPVNITCFGAHNGSVTINASGGTATYAGTGNFNGLFPGTYNYTVTDSKGCTASTSVTITQPAQMTASAVTSPVSCFGGNNGSVTINATGGTGPYTGAGNFGNLTAGTYNYTVNDSKGCTAPVIFTINQPNALNGSFTVTNVACAGGSNGTINISATGGTAPYAGTGNYTGLAAGSYNYTITDFKGCSVTVSPVITQPIALTASAIAGSVSCFGAQDGTVTIFASGGTTPYTGAGTVSGQSAGTNLYVVSDANGCLTSVSATIGSPAPLQLSETHTQIVCNGGSSGTATISATGGTGPYAGIGTFSGLSIGDHIFNVTDANGCQQSITVTITQASTLQAQENHNNVSCNGGNDGSVTITGAGGTAPYTGIGTFSGLTAGSYSYTITDANNCAAIVNVTITQPDILTPAFTAISPLCNGSSNGSITITAMGGTVPYTGTGTINSLSAGTYNYSVSDSKGCLATITATVNEPLPLTTSITASDVNCSGAADGTITITANGGTGPFSGTGTFTAIAPGNYNYTITDANGCTSTASATITEPQPLVLSETHTRILCSGGSDGTANIFATGGTAPYSGTGTFSNLSLGSHIFQVTDARGCQQSISVFITQASSLIATETHTNVTCYGGSNGTAIINVSGGTPPHIGAGTKSGLSAGTYVYTVTDAAGCAASVSVTINQPDSIILNVSKTNVSCNNGNDGSIEITASGGTAPYTGTGIFPGLSAGSYTYTIFDVRGCSQTVTVEITEPPVLSATPATTKTLCSGGNDGSVNITASGGTAPYTGTGSYSGLAAGTYNYTINDANGCATTISAIVGEPLPLTLSETNTQILCNGGANGTANIFASGGTAPYFGTGTFTGLALGPNNFTVTDANGCQQSITVNITQATSLTAQEIHNDVTCNGGSNGWATITATGGTAPYSGIGNFTNLSAGDFSYTVTDAAGCAAVITVSINEPALFEISETHTNVSCNGDNSGSITIDGIGGTAPYTGTGTFTGINAGTYTYNISDNNGCQASVGINISEPPTLVGTLFATDATCFGTPTGSVLITAVGGMAPYSGTGIFNNLNAGNYNYIITDANGCTADVNTIINEPADLIVGETHTQILCNGGANGTATIYASGGLAPYTGTGNFTGLALGPNDFVVSDANGCQKTITVNITQATSLIAEETHTDITCSGGSDGTITFTANGGSAPYTGTGIFTGLSAGNYLYTVTDAAGCAAVASINLTEPSAINIAPSVSNVSCNGGNNGTITISASGGNAPYTGEGTFTNLQAGTYNYYVTDANGCSGSATAIISEPAALTANSNATDAQCFGSNTGSITISAAGGTAPYTGEGTFTGITAGNYNYTITDANGCSTTINAVVNEPTELLLNETNTQILCNGGSTGTATISATGGTAPYTGVGTFTGLALGPNNFTVTDAIGCQKTITVNITQATSLQANESHTNVSCNGGNNGSVNITTTGGTAPFTGAGTFTGLAAGTYNYTVTDAAGCAAVASVTITEPPAISVSSSRNNVSCSGGNNGSITIAATGGTGTLSGTGTFTGLSAGNYNYTVTDASGCSATISEIISQPNAINAVASASNVSCNGASNGIVTISATGGTGPFTGTGLFTGLAAGNYNYSVSDANGCSQNVAFSIAEPTALSLSETHTSIACGGGSTGTATISATGGTAPYTGIGTFTGLALGSNNFTVTDANGCQKNITVNITQATSLQTNESHTNVSCNGGNNGSITITTAGGTAPFNGTGTFTGLAAGTYNYTVTDAAGCAAVTSVTITQPPVLSLSNITNNVSCNGGINGSITIAATGGTLPYSGAGTFAGLAAGTYNYTVTDANGCQSTISASITEPVLLTADETHTDPTCATPASGSVTLIAAGGTAPYSGIGTFTNLQAGTYNYTVNDANGCSITKTVTLVNPNAANLIITNPPSACSSSPVDITQASVTAGSDPGLILTYWTNATATQPLNNPQSISIAGTYYIKAENPSGCSNIQPVQVRFNTPPTASISGSTNICRGNSTSLTITLTGTAPFEVSYSNGNTTQTISGINTNTYQLSVSPTLTTSYILITVRDANCSGAANSTPAIITVQNLVPGIRYPDVSTAANTPTPLSVRDLGNNYMIDWNPHFGLNAYNILTPVFNYDQNVEYLITYSNAAGCNVVDTQLVIIESRNVKSGIWVPKAWTPNNSGKNDKLRPLCVNIVELKFFRVFNRWGQLMFETRQIGHGWDGMWNGKPQVGDVYTWTVEGIGIDGKRYFSSGNSILLR